MVGSVRCIGRLWPWPASDSLGPNGVRRMRPSSIRSSSIIGACWLGPLLAWPPQPSSGRKRPSLAIPTPRAELRPNAPSDRPGSSPERLDRGAFGSSKQQFCLVVAGVHRVCVAHESERRTASASRSRRSRHDEESRAERAKPLIDVGQGRTGGRQQAPANPSGRGRALDRNRSIDGLMNASIYSPSPSID